ncbi:hypothetical protein Fmac_028447 [Flemingia macrophylla]|uniref:Uncharacterized protein n=1 Tax=Flemingia macrophylla TaxID=520843 RepID=A0ABD1L7X1_9FABA
MFPPDESNTAFITEHANYCYKVMPFGLKNTGATYQRLMDKVFRAQIGHNMEVYIDDMVVKSASTLEHVQDLREVFAQLRRYDMRLNPEKCTFGVGGGKFISFMLTSRGIEANPKKCQAVLDIRSPSTLKETQRLAGRLTTLSRFIPRLAEVSQPILRLLKRVKSFQWTAEAETAFSTLKTHLASPRILAKPQHAHPIIMYLAVSNTAISSVLLQECGTTQQPLYFVSRTLSETEQRYQLLERVILGIVYTARRLRPYFCDHHIIVRTDCLATKVLHKPELAGRMTAWCLELSEFDITFEPRGPMKSQALVDFLNELHPPAQPKQATWTLYVDGSTGNSGSSAGIILEGPNGMSIEQSLRFSFKASNNQAEYEALLAGLRLAQDLGANRLVCKADSKIVVEQVSNAFQVKDPQLLSYYHLVSQLKDKFQYLELTHIPREQNERADRLAKLVSSRKPSHLHSLLQLELQQPSIDTSDCLNVNQAPDDWIAPIITYIESGTLPSEPEEAKRLRMRAASFTIVAGTLYKRGFSSPLLKCLVPPQDQQVIAEMYSGICGFHSGARSMCTRILLAGYYWPTMKAHCQAYVYKCSKCQQHGDVPRRPTEQLHHVAAPWPFNTWGTDILGPFPVAKGQCKFLIVAVDCFIKWIEAEPLAKIMTQNVQKFIWRNIITRFGIPHTIISNNGLQYSDKKLNTFLQDLGISHRYSSVEHPQANGQAEAANKVMLRELKRRLDSANGAWADMLPEILWAYRCTPHSTTRETPFRLTYGTSAIIPVEIGEPSFRVTHFDPQRNDEELRSDLDLTDELRKKALIVAEACKQRVAAKFNKHAIPRTINEGDLVWRATGNARSNSADGKLAASWEGPYRVRHNLHNGSYKLKELSGNLLPRTWNASHLNLYYL